MKLRRLAQVNRKPAVFCRTQWEEYFNRRTGRLETRAPCHRPFPCVVALAASELVETRGDEAVLCYKRKK